MRHVYFFACDNICMRLCPKSCQILIDLGIFYFIIEQDSFDNKIIYEFQLFDGAEFVHVRFKMLLNS